MCEDLVKVQINSAHKVRGMYRGAASWALTLRDIHIAIRVRTHTHSHHAHSHLHGCHCSIIGRAGGARETGNASRRAGFLGGSWAEAVWGITRGLAGGGGLHNGMGASTGTDFKSGPTFSAGSPTVLTEPPAG